MRRKGPLPHHHEKGSCVPKINTIFLIMCIVVICLLSALLMHFKHVNLTQAATAVEDISVAEYQQLLGQAHSLIRRYKQLRGNDSLPSELAFALPSAPQAAEEEEEEEQQVVIQTYGMQCCARDAVMGMAQDTDPKNLAVFIKSLKSVCSAAIILFVNTPVPKQTQEMVIQHNVKMIKFTVEDMPESHKKYHPSTLRWILFRNYINSNQKLRVLYNRIWLADVRDTYFQADPFLFVNPNTPSFHVFQGVESFPIAKCGWNSGWIKDCFSERTLTAIGNNPIICSGVSVGTTDLVLDYIETMHGIVSGTRKDPELSNQFPKCERNGVDQGVHNVLVHTHRIKQMKQWDQRSGPVANMQAKLATVTAEHKVLNSKGQAYSVVHQYDRFPDLQKHLFATYVDWVNTNDFQSVWTNDGACEGYHYRQDVDAFKGRCDLTGKGGASSAASCCAFCSAVAECKSFTFLTGMCYLKSCTVQDDNIGDPQRLSDAVSAWKSGQ